MDGCVLSAPLLYLHCSVKSLLFISFRFGNNQVTSEFHWAQ